MVETVISRDGAYESQVSEAVNPALSIRVLLRQAVADKAIAVLIFGTLPNPAAVSVNDGAILYVRLEVQIESPW